MTYSIEKMSDNISILFCVPLKKDCEGKTIKYENFRESKYKNETMKNLVCHLNHNIPSNPKYIIEEAEKWNFLNAFKSKRKKVVAKNIFMYNFQLCANYDLILDLTKKFNFFEFIFHEINVKMYLYTSGDLSSFRGLESFNFNFEKNDRNLSKLFFKQFLTSKLKKKTHCSLNEKKKKFGSCSKFYCYQQCFKKKIKSNKFFYTKNDDFPLENESETTSYVDEDCFNYCFENLTGIFYYLFETRFEIFETKSVKFFFETYLIKIVPVFLKTKDLFVLEVTGLFGILFGFNYLSFLFNFSSEFLKYVRVEKESLIKKMKILFSVFVVFNLLLDCNHMIQAYNKFLFLKTSSVFLQVENNFFSVSPCFDIRTIVFFEYHKETSLKANLFVLESKTMKFKDIFNQSLIKIINIKKKSFLNISNVEVFYLSEMSSKKSFLSVYKCFFIHVKKKKSLIQNLLGGFSISFMFNKPVSFYYLTHNKQRPNSQTSKIYSKTKFSVVEIILEGDESILKCKNYKNNCNSQAECIDLCFLRKHISEIFKIPQNVPIYMKWLSKRKYQYLDFDLKKNKKTKQLKRFCTNLYPLNDCFKKKIEPFYTVSKNTTKVVSIFLNRLVKTNSEVVYLNKHELFSNIITCINVWLGFNLPKLLKNIFLKINKKVFLFSYLSSIKNSNFDKILKLLFSFFLFLGLSYNLFSLSYEIINQKKVINHHYKLQSKVEYPYTIICYDHKKKIKLNKTFTYNGILLDELTFSANDVFESIDYFDNDLNKHTKTDFNKLLLNKTSEMIELSYFYYRNLKCFKIKYHIKLPSYYFYRNLKSYSLLVINLKPSINFFFFTLETKKSLNLNSLTKLFKKKRTVYFIKMTVEYKDFYIFLKDKFYFFRKKLKVNFNEAKSYSQFLKKMFKQSHNLTTLLLPLDKEYFNLTINNKEFLKFYKKNMEKLEKENFDKSFLSEYYIKFTSSNKNTMKNKLKLKPSLLSFETIVRDKIPIECFLLAVLNLISFWFNLSLMNILNFLINIIKQVLNFIFCFLFWLLKHLKSQFLFKF